MWGTYCRLHVSTSASSLTVIREARKKLVGECLRDRAKRDMR